MIKKLIVGLGNPGKKYELTRHNIGFIALEAYAHKYGFDKSSDRCKSIVSTKLEDEVKIILAKPQTFMNLSGEAVASLKKRYSLENKNILIIVDDVNLPFGKLRFRPSGSHGGHNGLFSVKEHLGTIDFPRLRIGVGSPPPGIDMKKYVLMKFLDEEINQLKNELLPALVDAIDVFITNGIKKAMNDFNKIQQSQD